MYKSTDLKLTIPTEEVYFGKAKDVVGDLRSKQTPSTITFSTADHPLPGLPPLSEADRDKATHREMINSMKK